MTEASPPSRDELFDALSVRRRRSLVRALGERDGPATLSELASELCSADGIDDGSPGTREREVRVRLHHVHAPKLEAAGLVEFDHERGVLEPTGRMERATPLLEWAADARREEA